MYLRIGVKDCAWTGGHRDKQASVRNKSRTMVVLVGRVDRDMTLAWGANRGGEKCRLKEGEGLTKERKKKVDCHTISTGVLSGPV